MIFKKIELFRNCEDEYGKNGLFKEILLDIFHRFKNTMNLLRSSSIVNMFVELKNIEEMNHLSPVEIKKLFKVGSSNLLEYHPLVLSNIDQKEKIIKSLCNKILLAFRLDVYGKGKFIDFYKQVSESIRSEEVKDDKPKLKKNTVRGGLKKRKKLKSINF